MLLLSTAYFPPVEYMARLVSAGSATIDVFETYPKQTWRNRCVILSGNGPVNLTIPVAKPQGNHTPTCEVIASEHQPWQSNHWKTITAAYRGAPFFTWYADLVKDGILGCTSNLLYQINDAILKALIREFDMKIDLRYTDQFIADAEGYTDCRFTISPKHSQYNQAGLDCFRSYYQVFADRFGFFPNASVLDVIFNLGPDTPDYLYSLPFKPDQLSPG